MKRILGWGLMVLFVTSVSLGAAACSHSHKDSASKGSKDSSMSIKREGSYTDKGDGY